MIQSYKMRKNVSLLGNVALDKECGYNVFS